MVFSNSFLSKSSKRIQKSCHMAVSTLISYIGLGQTTLACSIGFMMTKIHQNKINWILILVFLYLVFGSVLLRIRHRVSFVPISFDIKKCWPFSFSSSRCSSSSCLFQSPSGASRRGLLAGAWLGNSFPKACGFAGALLKAKSIDPPPKRETMHSL